MTWFLGEAPQPTGLPAAERPIPRFGETFAAGREAERIETDAWMRSARHEAELLDEMKTQMGVEYDERPWQPYQLGFAENVLARRRSQLVAEAARRRAAGEDVPFGTDEEFKAMLMERRKAEYAEAQAVLSAGPDGGWFAETLGRLYAGATDEATLATLPLGFGSTPARVAVSEAGLGMASEALVLGRQFDVSEDLDIDDPNVLLQLSIAGATGGVLGGGIAYGAEGVTRYRAYRTERERAAGEQSGDGSIAAADARIAEGEARLTGERGGLSMRDFDYGRGGNADPAENRIGYVYGRLLENGIEPHVAAGLLGNLMQESGVAINTRAVGDGGNAFGMAQWNGPRRRAYLSFAQSRGVDPDDIDTQIDFLLHEFRTTEADAWARIQEARTATEAALIASREFWRPGIPHEGRRASYAAAVAEQAEGGAVPRWQGPVAQVAAGDASGFTPYRTSRGYTGEGQVAYGGEGRTIDVEYEVVDLATLRQATGDLQPRDRTRVNSDAWVSDTAARLDPAQLMPAPTADRGAPIVGPDNVIESGNGRVRAIGRAYETAPDRIAVYRSQIEAMTGQPIPEGVERPVLVARRRSDLTAAERRQFVEEAQDSGVARMTATERARLGQRRLDADLMARFVPGQRLASAENRDFARDFVGGFPLSERNAFIAEDGTLSQDGVRQLQDSLFARAWDAPDVVAARVEAEPGEARNLVQALDDAAPAFARLRAEIDAGLIRPEFDISGFVVDAVRLITGAREAAARGGGSIAARIDAVLVEVDLFGISVAPLTQALTRLFYKGGRIARPETMADFLTRYADEARKAGRVSDALAGDPPDVLDVLKRVEPQAFGDLAEIGQRNVEIERAEVSSDLPEFADGARSEEAAVADRLAADDLRATAPALADDTQGWAAAQPFETLDELFERAPVAQARLAEAGEDIAARLDVEFRNPGIKDRASSERKVQRKAYDTPRRLTDISRGGFVVRSVEDGDAVVAALARNFDLIDEGMVVSKSGYVDRKVILRHDDGMLSEVQLWTPQMAEAKFGRGTALYEEWRVLDLSDPKAKELERLQVELYSAAAAGDRIDAAASTSSQPKVLKRSRHASSVMMPAVLNTSRASTGSQGPLGRSLATAPREASPLDRMAGRPSQLQNDSDMEVSPSSEDISNMGADRTQVNALRAGLDDDLEIELEDGSTVSARALLDDLDRDQDLLDAVDACLTGGRG